MADFSEKWGTDVDTAVQLALADLKLTIDEVDVTVLEEPSRGFFGIGSKLALVRVEKKKKPEEKAHPKKAETSKKNIENIKKISTTLNLPKANSAKAKSRTKRKHQEMKKQKTPSF